MTDEVFLRARASQVIRLLREERERRGLSMSVLAKAAGLSQSAISRIENGLRNPSLDTLLHIAAVIEVKLEDVIAKARRAAQSSRPK